MKYNIKETEGQKAINNLLILTNGKETEQEKYKRVQNEILKGVFEEWKF